MKSLDFFKAFVFVFAMVIISACDNTASVEEEVHEGTEDYTEEEYESDTENNLEEMDYAANDTTGPDAEAKKFAMVVASHSMMEINMAKMAVQRSSNEEVKALAETIKKDHTNASDKLNSVVKNYGWKLPKDMMEKHHEMLRNLQQTEDNNFNATYVEMMVQSHQDAIAKFEKALETAGDDIMGEGNLPADRETTSGGEGSHQELVAWINNTLPVLRKHLNRSQELEQGMQ